MRNRYSIKVIDIFSGCSLNENFFNIALMVSHYIELKAFPV